MCQENEHIDVGKVVADDELPLHFFRLPLKIYLNAEIAENQAGMPSIARENQFQAKFLRYQKKDEGMREKENSGLKNKKTNPDQRPERQAAHVEVNLFRCEAFSQANLRSKEAGSFLKSRTVNKSRQSISSS